VAWRRLRILVVGNVNKHADRSTMRARRLL